MSRAKRARSVILGGISPATASQLAVTGLCQANGLPTPGFEIQFAYPRRWKFDYAWSEAHIAMEQEGGVFGIGKPCPACGRRRTAGHGSVQRLVSDMEKYNTAQWLGWTIFRFTPKQVTAGDWVPWVRPYLLPSEATPNGSESRYRTRPPARYDPDAAP